MFRSRLADALIGDPARLALRALERGDLDFLSRMLAEPDVAAWFGDPEEELEEFEAHMGSHYVTPFLIISGGTPAGYFQTYHANAEAFWQNFGVPCETFGMDLSLNGTHRGRGLGRAAIALMTARLWRMPEVTRLQIDPDPRNMRAIRAYAACGFTARGVFPGYGEQSEMLYMTLERPAART